MNWEHPFENHPYHLDEPDLPGKKLEIILHMFCVIFNFVLSQ